VRSGASDPGARRGAFAVAPDETLLSFNLASSLMPLADRSTRRTYRWALALGLGIAAVAAAVGLLPYALVAAVATVPVVYILYLYDVNEWDDQPVPVILGTVVLAGALAFGFTLLWRDVILDGVLASFLPPASGYHVQTDVLLVVGLLVPVVTVLLAQVGPLWLIAFRRFDDLIDGLTFGVAAGAAFAAVETLVLNGSLLLDGRGRIDDPNAAVWVSIIVVGGLLKPVVYGSAVGIACASFSGKGEGHDGFTPAYALGVVEAIVAIAAFRIGVYLTGRLGGDLGVVLGLLWGVIVAAAMVLRVRTVLHTALLEGALEARAAGSVPATASRGIGYCGECELPLLHDASFCVACGASVRAASKPLRAANANLGGGRVRPTTVTWPSRAPATTTNRHSAVIMVVVAVAVTVLAGGVAAAVNAGTRPDGGLVRQHYGADSSGARNVLAPLTLVGTSGAGSFVDGPNGTRITVPDGWEIIVQDEDHVVLCTSNACMRVFSFPVVADATASSVMEGLFNDFIVEALQDVEGKIGPIDPPVDTIVDAVGLDYGAVMATNEGSGPVEGHAEVYITEGRNMVSVDNVHVADEYDRFADDYSTIWTSVIKSLPS
jgi:RsiW-degrading membrane proteinase PrsW (M82 family)